MVVAVFDPALLIYLHDHWLSRQSHCFDRFNTLLLHRDQIRHYGLTMALSSALASVIYQSFPWHGEFDGIGELRDLRQFILEDLQRARYIEPESGGYLSLRPTGIICELVESPEVLVHCTRLVASCLLSGLDPVIATWSGPVLNSATKTLVLAIQLSEKEDTKSLDVPLIWDDISRADKLVRQDWWPDLQRSVELFLKTDSGIRAHPATAEGPISFECSSSFWDSLDRYCTQPALRQRLIEAICKRVSGILDASLGDEPWGQMRSFRVTYYWRVHYRRMRDRLVLEEFGPHDIGGAS